MQRFLYHSGWRKLVGGSSEPREWYREVKEKPVDGSYEFREWYHEAREGWLIGKCPVISQFVALNKR